MGHGDTLERLMTEPTVQEIVSRHDPTAAEWNGGCHVTQEQTIGGFNTCCL
jgi:hypothetical protein